MICRGCTGAVLVPVLDLGNHRLPDFTSPGESPPASWPLKLALCPECGLAQLETTTPRNLLYHDRYGFRSGTNEAIRADLENVVKYALSWEPAPRTWLDIACNDGTLLSYVPAGITRTGCDPLGHLAQESVRHADRIVVDYFRHDDYRPASMDVITSVSMFYDLDDPGWFCSEVSRVLARRGIWVIQQNYAADMITSSAVDNICHEHVTYFSVKPLRAVLEKCGLEIVDVAYSPVNGGCFRTLVARRGHIGPRDSVRTAGMYERMLELHDPAAWRRWGASVARELDKTRNYLDRAQAEGRRVYLYGASTRGGTILQMIGAGPELLPYAVERQPGKVGKVMAATGIPIISEEQMRADPPDALLVSPWFFRDVFVAREAAFLAGGGVMVFPLPEFTVVTG